MASDPADRDLRFALGAPDDVRRFPAGAFTLSAVLGFGFWFHL
jgi:hypothetical protein